MSEQRRLAASTAVFGAATAISRVAGVVREIVAARFFGASPALGAFLIAFNVPNLVRSLVADSAISAAFVPVFAHLREEGKEPEAWRVASIVLWLTAVILGGLSALFILVAPWLMPLFVPGNQNIDPNLVVELSRWMFPIVAILGMTGVVTGILNSYEIFGVPALAPIAWNGVIIVALVALPGQRRGLRDQRAASRRSSSSRSRCRSCAAAGAGSTSSSAWPGATRTCGACCA